MDVIQMTREIGLIANQVFPKPSLPQAAFAALSRAKLKYFVAEATLHNRV